MYPVPVLNRNFDDGSNQPPNAYVEELLNPNFRYSRRFFLFNNLSGKKEGSSELEKIWYARKIILTTKITEGQPDKIYPPILTIEYGDRSPKNFIDPSEVDDDAYATVDDDDVKCVDDEALDQNFHCRPL